uniref:hydantoinase B/oxoprolinase family protein n=1 Tax=Sphingomonas sp. TaxID=28214 RepID=UPI00286A9E5B
ETVADSGGAGLHRGGNGIIMTYKFLEPGQIAIHDDRWFVPPWGVNGGAPGARATKILRTADGSETVVGNKAEDIAVEAGDELDFITWGGGGWGDPLDRAPALVAHEVVQGLVTATGARAYGVVLGSDGGVDSSATDTLRSAMRAARPATLPTFNTGPAIDELRRDSMKDTGRDAPKQPRWTNAAVPPEALAAE